MFFDKNDEKGIEPGTGDKVAWFFKADGGVWGGTNNWHNTNWSEGNKVGNLSPDELVGKLGSNEWHVEAG